MLALIVFLLINTLFVLKYTERQSFVSANLLLFTYLLIVCFGLFVLSKAKTFLNKMKYFNYYFLVGSFLVFLIFIFVNIYVDGNSLNTDRWSAMDVTIQAILNSEYPYVIEDHLGQTSSNLPGLFYVGLPFYLLGDVGFLQPFVFLISCVFLSKIKIQQSSKLLILFLFLTSPAYLWEIFAKSDLMSNLILLILFIFFWKSKFQGNYFKRIILLSFICAFFFLTRGIVVIPLILFLFSGFMKIDIKLQLKFVLFFLLSILLISFPVLITVPDINTLIKFNPFSHQTRYAPKILQILVIVVTFGIAFKVKSFGIAIKSTFILFSLLLFITFILNSIEEGFVDNLYGNLFDISYLSMILPFAIILIADSLKINTMHA